MGTLRVPLEIGDTSGHRTRTVDALAGTNATFSVVPSSILSDLGITPLKNITFHFPDGGGVEYPTGFAAFSTAGKRGFARVVFGPEDLCIIGGTTLSDQGLVIDPENERLVPAGPLPL